MKRYVLMAVAFVLVVASVFTLQDGISPEVVAGAGNEKNATVESLSDLKDLISFIESRNVWGGKTADDKYTSLEKDGSFKDESEESDKDYDFTSVTLHEETRTNSSQREGGISLSAKMNRYLDMYINENETYYVSKGYMLIDLKHSFSPGYYPSSSSSSSNSRSYEINVIFDMEIYVNKDRVYAKFHQYLVELNGHQMVDMTEILGQWIEFDAETAEEIFDVVEGMDASGYNILLNLLSYDLFDYKKHGSTYSIQTEVYDTYFDLSNTESPAISLRPIVNNYNMGLKGSLDTIVFSNINNTVIKVDVSNAEKMTAKEFAKFFEEAINEINKE